MAENKPNEQVKVTEHKDGSITVHQPNGTHHRGVTVLLNTDDVVREQVGGFANFLREFAVVGLAVGFIVGQQANSVVKQLVASFLDPLVQMWFGQNLTSRVAIIHHASHPIKLPWGAFVYTVIEFFFVVIAIYLIIKLFRLDKLKQTTSKVK